MNTTTIAPDVDGSRLCDACYSQGQTEGTMNQDRMIRLPMTAREAEHLAVILHELVIHSAHTARLAGALNACARHKPADIGAAYFNSALRKSNGTWRMPFPCLKHNWCA